MDIVPECLTKSFHISLIGFDFILKVEDRVMWLKSCALTERTDMRSNFGWGVESRIQHVNTIKTSIFFTRNTHVSCCGFISTLNYSINWLVSARRIV